MKFSIIISAILFSSSAFASVPNWVPMATKSAAVDQFVEWMNSEGGLYKITKIDSEAITPKPSQDSWQVIIHFTDSKGCADRESISQCTPVSEDGPLVCANFLSDCAGNKLFQSTQELNFR